MATLMERLGGNAKRPQLLDACCRLIDQEVARKSGFRGLAVKGGFRAIKKIKPGIIRSVLDSLFDEFIDQLEPYFVEYEADPSLASSFGAHISGKRRQVADSLLGVTDARAGVSKMRVARKLYYKLRPSAETHVQDAMPGMAQVLDRHLA